MNRYYKINTAGILICFLLSLFGCKKFLDEKYSKKQVVPTTVEDFQAIMDYTTIINMNTPFSGEVSATDYELSDAKWAGITAEGHRRMYTWEKDNLYSNDPYNDWMYTYRSVYSCNAVLIGLQDISRSAANAVAYDNVKGQALFFRAGYFLEGSFVFCLAYDKTTSGSDLGLPIKKNTDFNESYTRSTLEQTYSQILQDLKASVSLLPLVPLSPYRPCKGAAYGLLSRAYLYMRNYEEAELYADSCLALNSNILDYNTLTLTAANPISQVNNTEAIHFKIMNAAPIIAVYNATIPLELYNSYRAGDLRKAAFFKLNDDGTYRFKGSYAGANGFFTGIATDELYLIKAECLARKGKVKESMALLNKLLIKRWDKTKVYIDLTASDTASALAIILLERRKELLIRSLRWMDIKRLNKEGANISLSRTLNGKVYTLPANDLRFALPIPDDIIAFSGIEQNKR